MVNLSPDQFRLALGRRYERAKKKVTNPKGLGGRAGKVDADRNGQKQTGSTRKRLAKEHGVGEGTVQRAAKFARSVETVKQVDPEIEAKYISVAKKLATILRPVAKERQREHGETAPGRKKTPFSKSRKVSKPVHTDKQTAKLAGVSTSTVHQHMTVEAFRARYGDGVSDCGAGQRESAGGRR